MERFGAESGAHHSALIGITLTVEDTGEISSVRAMRPLQFSQPKLKVRQVRAPNMRLGEVSMTPWWYGYTLH
jgi:hypothetical protein